MGWLGKTPIVSLIFAAAMAAVCILLAQDPMASSTAFEGARDEAREYLVRSPRLEVDSLGELILDPTWIAGMRAAASGAESSVDIKLPPRMLARSQANLDGLIERAYDARMNADPAWRLGILDSGSPERNYVAHAFVHETLAGVILSVVVLLLVGVPLERTWGSSIFAAFVVGAIPAVAQAYRVLDASSGVPWSGGAGLSGALLGAYFIRSLGGRFAVPGWVVLPVWLGVESFVVRGFWIDDLGGVPWATLCAAVGLGSLVAGGLRLMNVETRVDALTSKRKARGPNPIVLRVARMRSDGDPYQAFDLIQAAWRDDPEDAEICESFYSIAVEVGQPEAAADAILPRLRTALKEGDVRRAIDYWFPLAHKECSVALEATALVRLGEELLDEGHPQEALFSLRLALETGVFSAHATRIANVARDLDVELTRAAATLALADQGLDPKIRADLASIVTVPSSEPPETVESDPIAVSRSQLDRRVHAEHQTVETTEFPLALDADLAEDLDHEHSGEHIDLDDTRAALPDPSIHTDAFSAESLSTDVEQPATAIGTPTVRGDSGGVFSHWDDQNALEADTLTDVSGALEESVTAEVLLDPSDLETPELGFDFGLRAGAADLVDPRDDETDSDFTPLMDATDELTSPMAPRDVPAPIESVRDDEFAFGGSEAQATSIMKLRSLKALEAVPLEANAEWIEIDADDRGKSKLPYSRIQAISMAAVLGLGPRPVLVLDFVLNWSGDPSEPMKLIRFRSDRFDPLAYAPEAANPLAALTAWVVQIERLSGATCLPSRAVLEGRFTRHASLEDYERGILMASADGTPSE